MIKVHEKMEARRKKKAPEKKRIEPLIRKSAPKQAKSEEPEDLPEDPDTRKVYLENWDHIRTRENVDNRVQDRFNYTLHDLNIHQFQEATKEIFERQATCFKINASFGFMLRHIETGDLRYFHASQNNNRYLDMPHLIRNEDDLQRFSRELDRQDLLEYIRQQRPDTKWVVHLVTNITFYVNKLIGHPMGSMDLPVYLPDERSIGAQESDYSSDDEDTIVETIYH